MVSLNSFLSNTIYFNRTNVKWGSDLTQKISRGKTLLNYGFESRLLKELSLRLRWNVSRSISLTMSNQNRIQELSTPKFSNRNYRISEFSIGPNLSYIYGTKLRLSLVYDYTQKQNQLGFAEKAIDHSIGMDARYNVLGNSILNGKITMDKIIFSSLPGATTNSTVGYVLLDGLLPGTNFLWNLDLTKKLAGNIELNLQYEGRKPSATRTIHTGRASLRAIF